MLVDFCLQVNKIMRDTQVDCPTLRLYTTKTINLLEQQEQQEYHSDVIILQMEFYRNECQTLNNLRIQMSNQLKQESYQLNRQLKQQLLEQQQINSEQNTILQRYQSEILQLKQVQSQQSPVPQSQQLNQTMKYAGHSFRKQLPTPSNSRPQELSHLTVEIKNIRTPVLETQTPQNLKELFDECVKQLYRDVQLRGKPSKDSFFQRNHLHEIKLSEEDRKTDLGKLDLKTLSERFFQHPHFLRMVEAQIFNIKCCDNMSCLYNFRQLQAITTQEYVPQEQSGIQRVIGHQEGLQFQYMQIRWYCRVYEDNRVHYQQLLAELIQIEREICGTPRKQKQKLMTLQSKLEATKYQLAQLQSHILS